jgi:hypothetical protein
MSGRKIVDEAEAVAGLAAADRSGLSSREWASGKGLVPGSHGAWLLWYTALLCMSHTRSGKAECRQ